jgi:hypothetical protein
MDDELAEYGHEEILQAVLIHLFTGDAAELEDLCAEAGLPVLIDADGSSVYVSDARTYRDAQVLTLDRGVLIELSDGSQFGLTLSISRRPRGNVTTRPAHPDVPRPGR